MSRTTAPRPRALAPSPVHRERPRHRPDFDRLECRALPTAAITAFRPPAALGSGDFGPLTPGPDGTLYFEDPGRSTSWSGEASPGALGRLAADGSIAEVPLMTATGDPVSGAPIRTLGPDGNFWGIEHASFKTSVDRVTPAGVVTWFDTGAPTFDPFDRSPRTIVAGPDGNLWFTSETTLGRITVDGDVTLFKTSDIDQIAAKLAGNSRPAPGADSAGPLPGFRSGVLGDAVATSADGLDWALSGAELKRFTADGRLIRSQLPWDGVSAHAYFSPNFESITATTDGSAWFSESDNTSIGRADRQGTISVAPVASLGGPAAGGKLGALRLGPDGYLWSTEVSFDPDGIATTFLRVDPSAVPLLTGSMESIAPVAGAAFEGVFARFRPPGDRPADTYQAQIFWGSLQPADYPPVLPDGKGGYEIVDRHTYLNPGSFPTQIEVTEYDPSGVRTGRVITFNAPIRVANPLGPALTEFPLPAPSAGRADHVADVPYGSSDADLFSRATTSHPQAITIGPDGATWFTEGWTDSIGRIGSDGTVTEFPTATASGFRPRSIAAGPDGGLWFTDNRGDVGRLDPGNGQVTMFPLPPGSDVGRTAVATYSGDGGPIVAGPDGALWFLKVGDPWIGRVDTDGNLTEYPLSPGDSPTGLVAGPDGALWFALGPNAIGRIDADGTVTRIAVPAELGVRQAPHALTFDLDGNLWFFRGVALVRMTPEGDFSRFPLSWAYGLGPDDDPTVEGIRSMTAAPDGGLWFAILDRDALGRVSPADGSSALFPVTAWTAPTSVVVGPDGNLWFTESGGFSRGYWMDVKDPVPSAIGRR